MLDKHSFDRRKTGSACHRIAAGGARLSDSFSFLGRVLSYIKDMV